MGSHLCLKLEQQQIDKSSLRQLQMVYLEHCKNKHQMVWSADPRICQKCLNDSPGFVCNKCSEYRCMTCSNKFKFNQSKKCPNRHVCKWKNVKNQCFLCCNRVSCGFVCQTCRFVICIRCSDLQYGISSCFNDHSLCWTKKKTICIKCNSIQNGWKCQVCVYNVCSTCANTMFNQLNCPNSHETTFKNNTICIKCNKNGPVMNCQKCDYSLCTKCELDKFKTNHSLNRSLSHRTMDTISNQLFETKAVETTSSFSARQSMMENKYAEAIAKYNQLISKQSSNMEYYLDLGQAYELNNNLLQALFIYQKTYKLNNQQHRGLVKAVRLLCLNDQAKMTISDRCLATRFCEIILQTDCQNVEMNLTAAKLYYADNKFQFAYDKLAVLYKKRNNLERHTTISVLKYLTWMSIKEWKRYQAIQYLAEIILLYQNQITIPEVVQSKGDWLILKGNQHLQLKQPEQAIKCYQGVEGGDQRFNDALLQLSKLY